jgi:hypothetical protein
VFVPVGLQLRAVEHYYQVLFFAKTILPFSAKMKYFSKKTEQTKRYCFFVLFWFPPFFRVFCKLDRLINAKVFAASMKWSNLQVKKIVNIFDSKFLKLLKKHDLFH